MVKFEHVLCTIIILIDNSLIEVRNEDTNILNEFKINYKIMRTTLKVSFWYLPLRKKLKFHLISWCGNFVETHDFCRVSETAFPQNSHTRKLDETSVFYAVFLADQNFCI